MSENFGNHCRTFNRGNDFQGAATAQAVLNVDIEYPLTKTFPGFRPSGRQPPFKTAPGGFVSSQAQLLWAVVG
jgi:hypothetical protein